MAVNSITTINDDEEVDMPIRHTISEATQQEVKSAVHRELLKRLDLERLDEFNETRSGQQQLFGIIHRIMSEQAIPLSSTERDRLTQEVLNEVFGLGPIEPLLHDPTVSDILVNTWNSVYVERKGLLEKTNIVFKDNRHLLHIIEKIVSAVGRRVDESSPMVDARLQDGSRVNAIIPPLAIDGPILSIRRFGNTPLTAEDLIRSKMLIPSMLEILRIAVQARLNIVVSGGTGAGKTTLLNVLSGFISDRERIVTVEDSAELLLRQEHVVRLETRPPNLEGQGAIRQRELIVNALRMRPDRIVVGEVRGEETLDMLQAMNTGHDGSITTIHANSPRDAVARLETMAMMANVGLPEKAIRNQIASAVHLIVQVARMSDGSRRITHIAEVAGTQADVVALNDLYLFERKSTGSTGKVAGRFYSPGVLPRFAGRLHDTSPQDLAQLMNTSVEV